jgi:hypothetical protein
MLYVQVFYVQLFYVQVFYVQMFYVQMQMLCDEFGSTLIQIAFEIISCLDIQHILSKCRLTVTSNMWITNIKIFTLFSVNVIRSWMIIMLIIYNDEVFSAFIISIEQFLSTCQRWRRNIWSNTFKIFHFHLFMIFSNTKINIILWWGGDAESRDDRGGGGCR